MNPSYAFQNHFSCTGKLSRKHKDGHIHPHTNSIPSPLQHTVTATAMNCTDNTAIGCGLLFCNPSTTEARRSEFEARPGYIARLSNFA